MNVAIAHERGIRGYLPAILRADAWGHGAELVRSVLADHGFGAGVEPFLDPAGLYGLPGAAEASPALRLVGTVLSTKELRAGEGVSYGYAYRAPADTRIALVTGGYAQGIVRALGGAADVAIAGERHPVVGRVAMDVCVVRIEDAAVRRGDEVLFLGDAAFGEPALAEWQDMTGLRASELITMIGLRAIREEVP